LGFRCKWCLSVPIMPDDVEILDHRESAEENAKKKARRSRWGQEPSKEQLANQQIVPAIDTDGSRPGGGMPQMVVPGMQVPGYVPGRGYLQPQVPMMDYSVQAAAAKEALEKAKKAALFQKQIQEQMAQMQGAQAHNQLKPKKLVLDSFGRELDEEGKVMPITRPVISTLKVNKDIFKSEEERKKEREHQKKVALGRFFDKSLERSKRGDRTQRRHFKFIEHGSLLKAEQRIADKVQQRRSGMDAKQDKDRDRKKEKKGEDEEMDPNLMELGTRKTKEIIIRRRDPVPEIEWWDLKAFKEDPKNADETYPWLCDDDRYSNLIEHPIPIEPAVVKEAPQQTMYLTKKERKKLRRLRRQQRNQEIRDKIKMGLIAAPPPKVKMSNLMRVLSEEAVADPSQVEAQVRAQMEKRKKDHEDRNARSKLSPEEKKAKKQQRWEAGTTGNNAAESFVSVYKIKELAGKNKYLVDINAQQFHFTGVCIIVSDMPSLVVVEGGARAIKRYRKLLLRRMKWKEDAAEDSDDSDGEGKAADGMDCQLVWDGVVKTRSFRNWKVHNLKNESEGRKVLRERGAEQYWDMMERFRPANADI